MAQTISTVVVGYDAGEEAERALARGADVVAAFDARLIVVAAAEVPEAVATEPFPELAGVYPIPAGQTAVSVPVPAEPSARKGPTAEELLHRILEKARQKLAGRGLEVEYVSVVGDAATALVDSAEAHGADLIVVGSRDHGLVERLLGGGVDSKVARAAPCDVLLVR
jgi:nucleotide-binding universal stress UspA family protein